jgi:hypothetical protein
MAILKSKLTAMQNHIAYWKNVIAMVHNELVIVNNYCLVIHGKKQPDCWNLQ